LKVTSLPLTNVSFSQSRQSIEKLSRDFKGFVYPVLPARLHPKSKKPSDFNPLAGFKTHFLDENNAAPYFDSQHHLMLGGAWATNGTEALKFYRNWFRPSFYQHAGFRIVQKHK